MSSSQSISTRPDRTAIVDAIAKSQAGLPIGSLFVALYIREDPPKKDNFHWALYVRTGADSGVKPHATGSPGTWMASHGSSSNILKEFLLCGLIQVGQIVLNSLDQLDRAMRAHDGELNTIQGLTCRTWVLAVMRKLIDSGKVQSDGGIEQLEHECMAFGNELSGGASRNEQPRPVVESKVCRSDALL